MGLLKKRSKLYGIFKMKCPRCHEGNLFETGTFSFDKPFFMPELCPECGQKYFLEPGFYYGAMFISYIITSISFLLFVGFCILVLGLSIGMAFFLLIFIGAILFIWIFRLSRSIWINLMVSYKGIHQKKN